MQRPQLCLGPVGRVVSTGLMLRLGPVNCSRLFRRLAEWLPDVPADMYWIQDLMRRLALEAYAKTKDQLSGLVR